MDKLYWNIDQLKPYEKNARITNDLDMDRLRMQIAKLGQYKPVLIESSGIVLGGNHRLQIYKEMGIDKVWVSVVEFIEIDGKWYAMVNGENQGREFPSKESAMMEYALSDNDRAAKYDEEQLEAYIKQLDIETELYSADLLEPTLLKDLENEVKKITEPKQPADSEDMPPETITEVPPEFKLEVTTKTIDERTGLKNKLIQLGYECKEI